MLNSKINKYILILTITTIIALIGVNNLFHLSKDTISTEKSTVSNCSSIKQDFKQLITTPSKIDNCITQNFSIKNRMIEFINYQRFNTFSTLTGKNVTKGLNNNLFYTDKNTLDISNGKSQFTKVEKAKTIEVLSARQSYMASNNINYLNYIIPNKNTIYSNYLPSMKTQNIFTRLDDYNELLNESKLNITNLKPEFLQLKDTRNLYYSNDSHWNLNAIEVAYNTIANQLRMQGFNNIKSYSSFEQITKSHIGDIPYYLGFPNQYVEKNAVKINLDSLQAKTINSTITPFKLTSGISVESQKYINNNKNLPKLLLLGDSYTDELRPLLAESFAELQFIKSYSEFPYEFIEEYKPNIIISLFNENNLSTPLKF
jgi:alginate O-acetyltransferase complex protein AlgJ